MIVPIVNYILINHYCLGVRHHSIEEVKHASYEVKEEKARSVLTEVLKDVSPATNLQLASVRISISLFQLKAKPFTPPSFSILIVWYFALH